MEEESVNNQKHNIKNSSPCFFFVERRKIKQRTEQEKKKKKKNVMRTNKKWHTFTYWIWIEPVKIRWKNFYWGFTMERNQKMVWKPNLYNSCTSWYTIQSIFFILRRNFSIAQKCEELIHHHRKLFLDEIFFIQDKLTHIYISFTLQTKISFILSGFFFILADFSVPFCVEWKNFFSLFLKQNILIFHIYKKKQSDNLKYNKTKSSFIQQ